MRDDELAENLGLVSAFAIGVGVMVCAGIFILPASAAAVAGPAAAAAFVVAGSIGGFTALSISELGTAMPKAGGAYYYINDALGPLFGSIAGWGNWIGLAAAVAFYLVGMGSYAAVFVPAPSVDLVVFVLDPSQVLALAAAAFFLGVNYVGTQETGTLQIVIVVILVGVLGVFVAAGSFRIDPANLRPFAPRETGGWGGVLPAAALVFVSYLGFAEINTVAEEIEDPGRNIPIAVLGSLVFATLVYVLVMLVTMGVVPYETVIEYGEVAVVRVAGEVLGPMGTGVLLFAGLLAMASSANASILASSRINFAMARDRIVASQLNAVHPRFDTPYRSIAVTGVFVVGFVLVGDIEVLAKAGSVLHLIVYGLLNVSLVVYRETDAEGYDPDFEIPLYPAVPVLGALSSFGLVAFMALVEVLVSLLFVAFGILWYLGYAREHSTKDGLLVEYFGS